MLRDNLVTVRGGITQAQERCFVCGGPFNDTEQIRLTGWVWFQGTNTGRYKMVDTLLHASCAQGAGSRLYHTAKPREAAA